MLGLSIGLVAADRRNASPQLHQLNRIIRPIGRGAGRYLNAYSRSHGIELADALIAAAAHARDIPLWTLNRRRYPGRDVQCFSPR
jgi:predicted nucleic acid-binding protein